MERQPIPLRKVPLIAKWSPEILARLLIRVFEDGSYILIAYESIEGRAARRISPAIMRKTLVGLDKITDPHSKIALIPANYFVWSDDLKVAYHTYHHCVSSTDELEAHDVFDMDPSTHHYDDLLLECRRFTSNPYLTGGAPPTGRDLRKQKTQDMYASWQDRAEGLKKINPAMSKSDIAKRIESEKIADGRDFDTIRRNISI